MQKFSWVLVFSLAVTLINYPNPFNPNGGQTITIECTADATGEAFLYIYDLSARLLLRRTFDLQGGATTRTTWNGYSDYNELVGSGIYFYQIIDKSWNRVGKGKIWVINEK